MRSLGAVLHPNKVSREKGRIAEERTQHAQSVAATHTKTLASNRQQALEVIRTGAEAAVERINAWYQTELANEHRKNAQAQIEYRAALAQLEQGFRRLSYDINRSHASDKPQLHAKLQDSYKMGLHEVNTKYQHDEEIYGCLLVSLPITRDIKLYQVTVEAINQTEKVEEQHQASVTSIEVSLNNVLLDIRNTYFDDLAQVRREYRATIINAYTAVLAGIATVCSGGLLGPLANSAWEASLQTSLALTSIGAAERAIKGGDTVGGNVNSTFSFSGAPRQSTPNFSTGSSSPGNPSQADLSATIAAAQRRLQQTAHEVRSYNTRHDAISLYPSRGTNSGYNFAFQLQLDLRQDNRLRVTKWSVSFKHNNQPVIQRFFAAIDPDLKPSPRDGVIMAELKMYGRMAKNTRDAVVHMVSDPLGTLHGGFVLGADVIEAGLHLLGKDYYPAAQQRNQARLQAWDNFRSADSLTQREAIGSLALQTLLLAPTGGLFAEAGVNAFGIANRSAASLASGVARVSDRLPITLQFDASRLHSGFPIDVVKVRGRGVKSTQVRQPFNETVVTSESISLGKARAELKAYLKKIDTVQREQLIIDINSLGFRYIGGSGDGKYYKFLHPERGFSIRIDDAHPIKRNNGCKYQHIHLFDKNGNSLNSKLNVVPPESAEAHIKIKELEKIMELKL